MNIQLMQLLIYCLVYPILWFISRLPWRLFYLFSDFIFFIFYRVVKYRKKTMYHNLSIAFPEKTREELILIRRASYKHMCDIFLEMIKSITISGEEIKEHFKITNIELFNELEKNNENIIVLMGHYGSYEWSNCIDIQTNFSAVGIYKKIANPYFDRLAQRIRARFGSRIIASRNAFKQITEDVESGMGLQMYGLISDQSPKIQNAKYWTDFMGVKVPAFVGGEVLANRLGLKVYYLQVEKVKRGYYEAEFVPLCEEPETRDPDKLFITKKYLNLLEKQIRRNPQYYLWSHKRWKHKDAPIPEGATVD